MPASLLVLMLVTQVSFAAPQWDTKRLIADELSSLKVAADRAVLLETFHRDIALAMKVDEASEGSVFVREAVFITWRRAARGLRVNEGTSDDLAAKLAAYLEKARPHFSKLPRRELDRDWAALRKSFAEDRDWIGKELKSLFQTRPVIVLDAGVATRVRTASKVEDGWRTAVLDEVGRAVDEVLAAQEQRFGDMLESVGVYSGPLPPQRRKLFGEELRIQMVEEPVVVLYSIERLRVLVRSLVNGAEMKAASPQRRQAQWGSAFQDLTLAGPGALFVGDVPADFKSGKRLGSSLILYTPGNAGQVPGLPRQQWWRYWNQTLNSWCAGLISCIRCQDTLHEQVLSDRLETWRGKVEKLEEFAGSTAESELSWDELDRQLLAAVRQARRELPLFTDHDRIITARSSEFRAFLHFTRPEITALVEKERKDRWASIDRQRVDQIVDVLRDWSLAEYRRRFSDQDICDNHISIRAANLFGWMNLDVRVKTGLSETQNFRLWEFHMLKRLNGKRLFREAAATAEELADCSEIERAFYEFFRATFASAPMFTELNRRYTEDDFRVAHDRFKAYAFTAAEKAAYDRLFPLLEEQLRHWAVPRPAPVLEAPINSAATPNSKGTNALHNSSRRETGTDSRNTSERPAPFALSDRERELLAANRWTIAIARQLPLAAVMLLTIIAAIYYRRRLQ